MFSSSSLISSKTRFPLPTESPDPFLFKSFLIFSFHSCSTHNLTNKRRDGLKVLLENVQVADDDRARVGRTLAVHKPDLLFSAASFAGHYHLEAFVKNPDKSVALQLANDGCDRGHYFGVLLDFGDEVGRGRSSDFLEGVFGHLILGIDKSARCYLVG
jgi:hypothetical protein